MRKDIDYYKSSKIFTIKDIIIIAIALVFSLSAVLYVLFMPKGERVEVYVKGELKYVYPLSYDIVIDIDGGNTLIIEGGSARISHATCPDKLCVAHAPISKVNSAIVCLPNNVIVIIKGKSEIDAVT